MYQWSERNPQHFDRVKTREFNIKLLQGQSKEIDKLINNDIDKTRYIPNLPTNSREFDILVLLILDVIPTFFSTHLKSVRSDLADSTTVIRDKKYGLSRDSLSHILEASKYWFTTIYYASGDIQGPRQISDLVSATLKSEQNSKEIAKFIFNDLQSSDKLYAKGQLDSQIFHTAASILNEYIKDLTFVASEDVSEELSWLFSSFTADPTIMDQDYASIIEQRIKNEVLLIYRRTHDEDKVAYISDNWNSIYDGIKRLFTQETDKLLRELPGGHYELVWEDKIVHSFLRFENGEKVMLAGNMLLSDANFIGIIDSSSPNNLRNPASSETFDVPMIVIRDKNDAEKWGLIRSDELPLLPDDYKFSDIILNTKEGHILDGQYKLGTTLNDLGKDWYLSQSYLENPDYFFEKDGVFTLKNCYRYIMYFTGENLVPFLQESIYNFVPAMAHEQYFVKEIKKTSALKGLGKFEIPTFKEFTDLDKETQEELSEILSILQQFGNPYLPLKDKAYNYETISDLIISENFFDKETSLIKSLLNDLNPTTDQLSDLSYSRQKVFYNTLHELLMGYTGSSTIINSYKASFNDLSQFQNVHSIVYTNRESEAVKSMEKIMPALLGYRFWVALKLGIISLFREESLVVFQPIIFHYSVLYDLMTYRRINALSAQILDSPYTDDAFKKRFREILSCALILGHVTILEVENKGVEVIRTNAGDSLMTSLSEDDYSRPTYPQDYGKLNKAFMNSYFKDILSEEIISKKNINGKTVIMQDFSNLLQTLMNPKIIKSAGDNLGITAFKDNPDVWSKKAINFAFENIFRYLIKPDARQQSDPTQALNHLFTGKFQLSKIQITNRLLSGITSSFWLNPMYGDINLDYYTFIKYFGNDFSRIQPALYYTQTNLLKTPQPLSVNQLFTSEFKVKVDHLFTNFYNILSSKYDDGQKLTAFFHKEDSLGFHAKSRISESLDKSILKKFDDYILGTSLSFQFEKEGGKIMNDEEFRQFIASICFYLVMFNAQVFIKEGSKRSSASYSLFASQRDLFDRSYIVGLSSRDITSNFHLSDTGNQILDEWNLDWNTKNGVIVWNFGDCWPIYLFGDARDLISKFIDHFDVDMIDSLI